MNRILIWTCAAALTLALSGWQRRTGPTYAVTGSAAVDGQTFRYRLERSFAGAGDAPVRIPAAAAVTGALEFRRAGSSAAWTSVEMVREDGTLAASLPHQPMAGKLEYRVRLRGAGETVDLGPVTIRFRGDVPALVLIPHITCMFLGFLFAARAGLAGAGRQEYRAFALAALVLIGAGGLILGPIVQKIALGDYWTGWPLGPDLTDNKTLVAWLFWLPPVFSRRRGWAIAGAVVTFLVFAVPHSLLSGNVPR